MMVRVVAGRRPSRRNEDLAIATFSPLPGNPIHFPVAEDILREYLEERRGITVKDVQPCHLGQAFVRFDSEFDRDRFVSGSPHAYGDIHISFVRHNQGRNWRRVNFNQECWVMLMGLPNDYWDHEYLDSIIGPFGKVLNWINDPEHLARLLVRIRVVDLETIPHFIVFSDTVGFEGDSWTIQVEILQNDNIGMGPPEEEQVPIPQDQGPPLFDFFGLGQPVLAPVTEHANNLHHPGQLPNMIEGGQGLALGNGLQGQQQQEVDFQWPDELPALGQNQVQINLNQAPMVLDQDLNALPHGEDLQEMSVHPAQGQLLQDEVQIIEQQELMQPQIDVPIQMAAVEPPVNVHNNDFLVDQLENFLHHEIEEDELMEEAKLQELAIMEAQNGGLNQPVPQIPPVFQNDIQLGLVRTFVTNPILPPVWPSFKEDLAPKILGFGQDGEQAFVKAPSKWLGLF